MPYVVAQFVGLLLVAWPWSGQWPTPLALLGWLPSLGLALWSLWCNPPGNFRIRPVPHPKGRLVCTGPYRYIRHPMYASLLLFALGCVLGYLSLASILAAVLLWVVLWAKARREEQQLLRQFSAYRDYRVRTGFFLPSGCGRSARDR
ncbi:isoprenylcysteine carboxylmethyltransferase family protein [Pseudaeromonas paramecii]|uniref:Isoprenylcysteine carboxylmethyltransferase family protein n=1 Tax=Pseudaeromonas paramecii TaxID=2138166 RepID=A0ABP8QG91_9GAMM